MKDKISPALCLCRHDEILMNKYCTTVQDHVTQQRLYLTDDPPLPFSTHQCFVLPLERDMQHSGQIFTDI